MIAVGTTSVRALETVFQDVPDKYNGETNLFIYPGYEFKVVDLMITNFHLPKSSLLMLVSAFIGHQEMHRVYQTCLLYTSPSPRDATLSRMPSSA